MARKILIVDDDQSIRETYVEVFKREGFEVEEAVDGLDGLDKATKSMPDIIFTGIIMPRMDGFGLKEALSKNVSTANIPVVMSSHMGRKEDEEKAKEMGIKDFFVVGMITPREVMEKVNAMFGSGGYRLKFSTSEFDGPKLAQTIAANSRFECGKCGTEMIMELKSFDLNKQEFTAKIICPNCGK